MMKFMRRNFQAGRRRRRRRETSSVTAKKKERTALRDKECICLTK